MTDTLLIIIALIVGGATFGLILKKFGSNCIP